MTNRKFFAIIISAFPLFLCAQKKSTAFQEYFDRYHNIAIEQMKEHGIPASITLAQGVFESGAGKSELTRRSNNHFGIKCHGWTGKKTYHSDDHPNDCFRVYANARESFEDHSQFLLTGQRYRPLFRLGSRDYKGWAHGLKKAGYATNPQYANKLIQIIELYELHKYDIGSGFDKFIAKHGGVRTVTALNGNYCVVAKAGDTFRSIADDVGVSYSKLARYNERDKHDVLTAGGVIYLKKKAKKATKEYKGHIHYIQAGESMYSISQKYGIRVMYLYKINGLTPDYRIKVGDGIRVR
jgi:LysM repeat protein